MIITPQDLVQITHARIDRAQTFAPIINNAAPDFGINTKERMSMFLAQIGHESGGLHWLTELWGPTDAQLRYEGRADLGNTVPGDGYLYRGRGLIQITGRHNYERVSQALATDFVNNPDQLAEPEYAVRSAMWFWESHGLNDMADCGQIDRCTKVINGGYNGLSERVAMYNRAQQVFA